MELKNKKGIALNQAFGAVLILVLVATLVIISLVIFSSLNSSFAGTISASVINESNINATGGTSLEGAANCSSSDFVVSSVNNDSSVIDSGNYTVDSSAGTISNITDEFQYTLWNVTYTYTWGSDACTAGDDIITQFATYPVLIGLVGTIIFLGLVIGVLVASFAFGGRKGV